MFLTPLFLVGGALAATVPIILHLLQKRRRVTIPFSTLRFLKLAQQKSSRMLHMENLLLWLLRTAIMLLLGAAFAMPVLRAGGLAWLDRAPRDVAIVIDASYSMGYRTGRDTVLDKAIATANEILKGLGEKDRYCLFLAGDQPQPLVAEPIGDREPGYQLLKGIAPGPGGSRLTAAIQAAREALDRDRSGREREIYVLTDGQAAAWRDRGDAAAANNTDGDTATAAAEAGQAPAHYVTLLGPPTPVNLSPVALEKKPPLLVRDAPARITVRTLHNGPDRESIVRLLVGDEELGRRPLRLAADGTATAEFTLPPRPPGVYPARVTTPEDALEFDNTFHFLVRVRDRLPVLCVGTDQDTVYLRTALRAAMSGGAGGVEPERIESDAIGTYPLHQAAVVFLCNALPLPGQALAPLEDYVRNGGLLVVFPGERATAADYQAWTTLPLADIAVEDPPALERGRTLTWSSDDHPLMRRFQRGMAPPRISIQRHLAGSGLVDGARGLISLGPEQPFLAERDVGQGKVLMFTVAADRTWGDFPLSPFYLPLLAQIVDYSGGVGVAAPFLWTSRALALERLIPGATRETVLVGPDSRRVPVSSAVIDGVAQLRVENLDQPGIYEVEGAGAALAVNMPREESDLAPLVEGELERVLAVDPLYVARDSETLQRLIEENNVGRTFGEPLLWVVLLLVAIEFVYANHLARARPALTDQLSVEASGRIKGHAEATS